MGTTSAATIREERRALTERLEAWRQTKLGPLTRYAIEVGLVAGIYCGGTARLGLRLGYVHGSVTALWPPLSVGIAPLDPEFAVRGRPGHARGFTLKRGRPAA